MGGWVTRISVSERKGIYLIVTAFNIVIFSINCLKALFELCFDGKHETDVD